MADRLDFFCNRTLRIRVVRPSMKILTTPKTLWRLAILLWIIALCGALLCYLGLTTQSSSVTPDMPPPTKLETHRPHLNKAISLSTALKSPYFSLNTSEHTTKLPDLRTTILYYGCNGRPDNCSQNPRIQFGIRGTSTVYCANAGEKVFFRYDFRSNRWSHEDDPTPLSFSLIPSENGVAVTLEVKNDKGVLISPQELHQFQLPIVSMPVAHGSTSSWSIGSIPVDAALLDRFGVSWFGRDCVIQSLGGEEMKEELSSERLEFHMNDSTYTVFVKTNDYLAYIDDQWKKVLLGEESVASPLLQVRSIDDNSISFHLWNSDGSHQLPLTLRKKNPPAKLEMPEIRILGIRSLESLSVEILGKKLVISPNDWLVVSQNSLTVIDDEETLDTFMQGELNGSLLAFSGLEKMGRDLNLRGTFFDSTKTIAEPFAIPVYQSSIKPSNASNASKDDESDEDDEDDLFEDDDSDDEEDEEDEH